MTEKELIAEQFGHVKESLERIEISHISLAKTISEETKETLVYRTKTARELGKFEERTKTTTRFVYGAVGIAIAALLKDLLIYAGGK
jgi:hypothetical protein